MNRCALIDRCAFYSSRVVGVPGPSSYMKEIFCHKRPEICRRLRNSAMTPVDDLDNCFTPLGMWREKPNGSGTYAR